MSKFMLGGVAFITAFLTAGSYLFPSNMIMWFASTSTKFDMLRIFLSFSVLVLVLVSLYASRSFHIVLGAAALTIFGVAVFALIQGDLHFLDMLWLVEMSAICGLAAIDGPAEYDYDRVANLVYVSAIRMPKQNSKTETADLPDFTPEPKPFAAFIPKALLKSGQMPKTESS